MAITSNIEEIIKGFEKIANAGRNIDVTPALVQGVNAARAQMLNRIFNQGLDIVGDPLGKYKSADYRKKRTKAGRQIAEKDLEFSGSLRRAIITASDKTNTASCFINNAKELLIADYQEQQVGKIRGGGRAKIWGLSQDEKETLIDQTNKALNQIYVGIFNS